MGFRRKFLLFFILLPWALPAAIDEARSQLKSGHREEAIKILRDDLMKEPDSVAENVLLTEILLRGAQFEEAREVIQPALARKPDVAALHVAYGDELFREGRIFDADAEYRVAYKSDAHNARAVLGVARALQAGCVRQKAAVLFREAYRLKPDDPAIAAAYFALEGSSAAAVSRWENQLSLMQEGDPSAVRRLTRAIAAAKALNGKPEFQLASTYEHAQLPLQLLMDGRRFRGYGVEILIDGSKSVLQLDTGASHILINNHFAEKAGVRRIADVEIGGVGNQEPTKGWLGYAEKIAIGPVEFRNCIVEVSDRNAVSTANGLIGTDVFKRFLIRLDFRSHKLVLDPLPGPAWDGYAPVDRYGGAELQAYGQFLSIHHYILVPTKMTEKMRDEEAIPGLFLLDTGSSTNMLSTNAAQIVTRLRNSSMRVKGLNGGVRNVYEADQVVLTFQSFRQQNLGLISVDLTHLSRGANAEVSGVMGLPLLDLFASITLDYRDGRLKFDYKN